MNPRKYFGYIRVSTQKQGEKGVSLQEQKDAIQRFAPRQGLEIIRWFEERETAAKRGRPIFLEMLKLLRKGKAEGAVIHKIDRSARNLKDWADLGELIDQGVVVRFANEDVDMNTRGGRLSADIQAVIAADFIRNLREETKKGMYGRLKQGIWPLAAPLGYLDQGKGGKLKVIDPVMAPLVRKVFELYSTAKYSLTGLAEEAYRMGLRSRYGSRVNVNGMSNIINNPFYIGILRIKRNKETYPGLHQRLISPALYQQTQDVLHGRTNIKALKHAFLFAKLLKCATCKYCLIGELQKGKVYYRCHTRSCPRTSIREDRVDHEIARLLEPLQFTLEDWTKSQSVVEKLKERWQEEWDVQVKALSVRLEAIMDRSKRLTDAYLDRAIEKEDFEERKSSLLVERTEIEESLDRLKTGDHSVPDQISQCFEMAGSVHTAYRVALPEEKRDTLKSVTSNRIVDQKKLELVLLPPFEVIARRGKISISAQSSGEARTWEGLVAKLVGYFSRNPARKTGFD